VVKERPLTQTEMTKVLRQAERESLRDYCLLTIASQHAIRSSELSGLCVRDVNLKDNEIHIRRLKGSVSQREQLTAFERPVIEKWLAQKPVNDLLFPSSRGGRICRTHIYRIFRHYAELAMIPDSSRSSHAFRHHIGQELALSGIDIQTLKRIMGHKNISSTERYFEIPQSRADEIKEKVLARRLKAA
jgi:integrase